MINFKKIVKNCWWKQFISFKDTISIIKRCNKIYNFKKKTNVSVSIESISNLLSICGLKLERMLTMIYKKKRNFKIESINNVSISKIGIQLRKTP